MWRWDVRRARSREASATGWNGDGEGKRKRGEEKGVRREGVIMNTRSGYATVPEGSYLNGEEDERAPCTRVRGMASSSCLPDE